MKTRRSTPARLGAIVAVVASLVACVSLAGTAAASPGPVVHLSTTSATLGQLVDITGTGWSPVGQTVQMQLCGQNAQDLSNDCDQANQYTAAIRTGGVFYGALVVHVPPSPCPCVVVVSSPGGVSGVNVPITIVGAPTDALPSQAAPRAPVALSAQLLTPVSVSAWFGGPKAITLVLRVTNQSPIAYGSPALTVNVGRGSNPNDFVMGETLAPLAVGATQVLRIPVTLPPFTYGHYTVRAQVITGQGQVATEVGTSSYPWGLFAAAAVLLLLVIVLLWRRRRRRRRARSQPAPETVDVRDGGEATPAETQEVART